MKTTFFVADDIQTLSDNKLMIIGLYPDVTLRVEKLKDKPSDSQPALARLCLLLHIDELPTGLNQVQPVLIYPDGSPAARLTPMKIKSQEGKAANLICKLQPFPIPAFGVYKFEIMFGDNQITHEFNVIENETRGVSGKKISKKEKPLSADRN